MEIVARRRTVLHYSAAVLVLAVVYGVVGRLCLSLAIPPGYATLLWPPSGLALAAILIGGKRMWPGIWLGSFAANIGITIDATESMALLTSAAIASGLSVGAVVQALVGAALVHRWVGSPSRLASAREIGALLVLGGPISCFIGATIGVTVLAISGQISPPTYLMHWGTWWVGDSFGVFITTPMVLSWLAEAQLIWRQRRPSISLPLLVLGALLLITVVFGYTRTQERERLRLLFELDAKALAHAIQNRLDESLGLLHVLGSFYSSVPHVGGHALHTFIQGSLPTYPGLQVLAWNPHVTGALQGPSPEALPPDPPAGAQLTEPEIAGKVLQAAPVPADMSLTALVPEAGPAQHLDFDGRSILSYSEELQKARDTGRPAITKRLTLAQDPGYQFGLLVFLPTYGPGLLPTTVAERRKHLRGYVVGVFRIDDMVEAALQGLGRNGMVLRIEDDTAPADQRLLYDSRGEAAERSRWGHEVQRPARATAMHWLTTVKLASQGWTLHILPTAEYLAARHSYRPWVTLGGGLVFTSLLSAFLLIITGRAAVIEQLMVERTKQLETSKRLEAEAEHRRRAAESLAEVGRLLSQSLDALDIGQQVVDHVQQLLVARVAALYQLDPVSGMLVVLAGSQHSRPITPPWRSIPPGVGAVGRAVEMRQPVVTADILNDPRITLPAPIRAGIELASARAELALPLLRDDRVIGALSIGDALGRTFDQEDLECARLFADQASAALANAQLYAEVQAAHERLQGLSRQLLEAQEAERRRIAHELHDQAGQLLVSVHLALEAALTRLPAQFRECFTSVRGHLDAIEAQLRRISHELRPTILDDLGLLPALQFMARGVAERTGLRVYVDSALDERLAPHIETALYRIMQEGLTNITKHAAATHVRLYLERDAEAVRGLLQDDGIGFAIDQVMHPEAPRGLGLLGIQERLGALGGTLQIISAPGQGTTLQITIAIEPQEVSADADEARDKMPFQGGAYSRKTGVGDAA